MYEESYLCKYMYVTRIWPLSGVRSMIGNFIGNYEI